MKIRLHQFLSRTGHFSSKNKAKNAVWDGSITVGGRVVKDISYEFNPEKREVLFKGIKLSLPSNYDYFILNKPAGVICSRINKHERSLNKNSVFSLFEGRIDSRVLDSLVTVGRLDEGTTGLLIMTNDGSLVNDIANPSKNIGKTYAVKVSKRVTSELISSIRMGVSIDITRDGMTEEYLTMPAEVTKISNYSIEVTIFEGKKRQIRRMIESLGNRVLELHRSSIGGLNLDAYSLNSGEYKKESREVIMDRITKL
jgi:pseudouridine synthase|tara:strand:- start:21199 stop:21963 length:765 start_codon:yes stop_codon:yes gene_type:complete